MTRQVTPNKWTACCLLAASLSFMAAPEVLAGSAKKLKMDRYDLCIGFNSINAGQQALLLDCADSRVPNFRHTKYANELRVSDTSLCLDLDGYNWLLLQPCVGESSQRWLPMFGGRGYAFFNMAEDCLLDDWGGPNIMCEDLYNSLNKDHFASSQIFVGLGNDFID